MTPDTAAARTVEAARRRLDPLYAQIARVIVGQRGSSTALLVGLLTGGHVLLEGVPGLAKTLAVRTLAQAPAPVVPAHPVHARPAARRRHRHADLQPAHAASSPSRRGRSSPTSSSPTRSTAPPPRCRAPCWKRCRRSRSPSATTTLPPANSRSSCWRRRTPSSRRAPIPLPEAQVDRFMLKLKLDLPDQRGGVGDPRPHGGRRAGPRRRAGARRRGHVRLRRGHRRHLRRRQDQALHRGSRPRDAPARTSTASTWRRTSSTAPARGRRSF